MIAAVLMYINPKVRMAYSPESKLADIRALLDSYAVELSKGQSIYLRAPLHFLEYGGEPPQLATEQNWEKLFTPIDSSLKLRMIQYEPPDGDDDFLAGIRERATRWPFYVHQPLSVMFAYGEQWWEYRFTPGKTYEVR